MDQERLRESAMELEAVLASHAGQDDGVDALHRALQPLIQAAIAGTITQPMNWTDVPGDRPFVEGEYAAFPDVEDAYSKFKFLVSGEEELLDSLPSQQGKRT